MNTEYRVYKKNATSEFPKKSTLFALSYTYSIKNNNKNKRLTYKL
jgi:hypothetical protein